MSRNDSPSEIDAMMDGIRRSLRIEGGIGTTPAEGSASLDAVMRRLNDEVARRRGGSASLGSAVSISGDLPRWLASAPRLVSKREYVLRELLAYSDADFIDTAYRALLRRPADPAGHDHFLMMLRSGSLTKIEVLAALRWSPEGEARGVHVDGLLAPYLLHKWRRKRFIGPVIAWCQALVGLGSLPARVAVLDSAQARESQEIGRLINRIDEQLEWQLTQLRVAREESEKRLREQFEQSIAQARGQLEKRSDEQLEHRLGLVRAEREAAENSLRDELISIHIRRSEFEQAISGLNAVVLTLQSTISNLGAQGSDAASSIEAITRNLHAVNEMLDGIRREASEAAAQAAALDPLYAAFEGRFRGDRALVRSRAEPFLHMVRESGVGTVEAPVLDVGCGRGEWLELLRDNGLVASGIDTNRIFIDECRGLGLDVVDADAIEALRRMADGSVGAITSMHLVEHLEFGQLVAFLEQAHRVLRPGGLIVLETPNPENLSVATHWFYMDPTHRNPLPPEALRWFVEFSGFEDARIERLTHARETNPPPYVGIDVPGSGSLNTLLLGLHAAPDYAIVAKREGAARA